MIMPLTLDSCDTNTYATAITSQTAFTLLSPETFKAWINSTAMQRGPQISLNYFAGNLYNYNGPSRPEPIFQDRR